MYLIFGKVHKFIEEENGSKSLVFDSTDEHKEVFKKKTELWDVTKNEIETINGGKVGQYRKGFMKTKFDSYDNLPSNKKMKFPTMTMIIRSAFEEDDKLNPQIYLDDGLYEL